MGHSLSEPPREEEKIVSHVDRELYSLLRSDRGIGNGSQTILGPGIQAILDALPFYVMLLDGDHRILMANRATREHLGFSPQELAGKYCPQAVHGITEGFYPGCPLEESLLSGRAEVREYFDKDTSRWVRSAVYPTDVWTAEGQKVYFHMIEVITECNRDESRSSRYGDERQIADALQTALPCPEWPQGVGLGHTCRSATEGAGIGGDFYDVFELGHGSLAVVIGDISGRGIRASSLMAVARNTVRAYALDGGGPCQVMAKTNKIICRSSTESDFMTMFYAELNTATGQMNYCNGGHPPALIKRENGDIRQLSANSPIVGAFPEFTFSSTEETIQQGDILILYTDGVIEALGKGARFGLKNLLGLVRECDAGPAALPDLILSKITDFTGDHLTDDTAILAISLERQMTLAAQ